MISSKILQLLLFVSSMTSQVIGMIPQEITRPSEEVRSLPFRVEGIAQRIEELPKELRYNIFSSALALRENPKYEVYKKLDIGSTVRGIALTADNTRALIGSDDGVARIWDVEKGEVLKELKGHTETILSVALSTDGILALTCSLDGRALVWNMNTGDLLKTLQVGSNVNSVALSANGAIALTGSLDGIARLYNTSTGGLLKELKGHTEHILSVALSADGTLALTGSWDGTARIWNTLTGKSITLQVGSAVYLVALSADGTIALTKADRSKVLVWDAKSATLLNTVLSKSLFIHSVALSKDGKRALTGTHEGKIEVWNTKPLPEQKETSTPLTVLEADTEGVTAVAFGDADFIASGSRDGTALIWKPFALEPRGPQENVEIFRQAYKETFSRPLLRSTNGN